MYLPPGPRVTGRRKDNMEQVLPTDVAEGIPPQQDLWTNAPGELVWMYEADPEKESLGMTGFSWQVRKCTPGIHDSDPPKPGLQAPYFQASTPYRAVFYQAASAEEALACLLKGMCTLCREGAMNPRAPHRPGAPPIQHAIHILTERLLLMVEQRQDHLVMSGYADNPAHVGAVTISDLTKDGDDQVSKEARDSEQEKLNHQMMQAIARDNEIVSALATAISSLARVKDL